MCLWYSEESTHIRGECLRELPKLGQAGADVYGAAGCFALVEENAEDSLRGARVLDRLVGEEHILGSFKFVAPIDDIIGFGGDIFE